MKGHNRWIRSAPGRLVALLGAVAVTGGILGVGIQPKRASADPSWIGAAGTDTSLSAQDSAVTYKWLATHNNLPSASTSPFANLQVSVNQTTDLSNQAVSVSWTGAPIPRFPSNVDYDWLQVFECWGSDDGSNPANPGPPPEQCEFGGQPFGQTESKHVPGGNTSFTYTRIMASPSWSTFNQDKPSGYVDTDPNLGLLWRPFRAVDGTVVPAQWQTKSVSTGGLYDTWLNQFFDLNTSNEDDFALNSPSGTGSELFQIDTGLEAPGLGCGQQTLTQADGSQTVPQCWLVIVPRHTATDENPPDVVGGQSPRVYTSPLTPEKWPSRIAVPLQLKPVGSSCQLGQDQRRIAGGELAVVAAASWAPALCATPGLPPYAYTAVGDSRARSELTSAGYGAAGMAVVTRPIDPATVDPTNPIVYAPTTLSGLTIGFNVERYTNPNYSTPKVPVPKSEKDAESLLAGVRVAHINLTPRLVAKLLTESYLNQFPEFDLEKPSGYDWVKNNSSDLTADPDFMQFNPEFYLLFAGNYRHLSGLLTEQPTSDAAYELWRWILADPEASAWLAGNPDPWGMKVNPLYNTNPSLNKNGVAFASPTPESFPANDPYCSHQHATSAQPGQPSQVVPLCMLDAHPFSLNMKSAAQNTRAANDGAKTVAASPFDPASYSPSTLFQADGPDAAGQRSMITVTDSASAAEYGLQTASLSQAGDDSAGRTFVAPSGDSLLAGQRAMKPSADPTVLETDPATRSSGAYPLAMLSYAAAAPRSLDQGSRNDYASFVTYAATNGQAPGIHFGQLPPGYAPLPADLQAQAVAAAALIRSGDPAAPDNSGSPGGGTPGGGTPGGGASGSTTGGGGSNPGTTSAGSGNASGGGGNGGGAGVNSYAAGPPSTSTKSQPPQVAIRPASSRSRTPFDRAGGTRYVLLIAFLVGISAAVGSRLLRLQRRNQGDLDEAQPDASLPVPYDST